MYHTKETSDRDPTENCCLTWLSSRFLLVLDLHFKAKKHTSCSADKVFWEWIMYRSSRGSSPFIIEVINAVTVFRRN